MEALLERSPVKKVTSRGVPEGQEGQVWTNGRWVNPGYFTPDDSAHGGIDGEERMGTGTAFDTDEAPPVYTPAGS